jgi:hypothetical protein
MRKTRPAISPFINVRVKLLEGKKQNPKPAVYCKIQFTPYLAPPLPIRQV